MAFLIKPVAAYSDSTSFPVGNRNRCQMEPVESQTGSTHIILFLIFLVSAMHFRQIPNTTVVFDHFEIFDCLVLIAIDLSIDFWNSDSVANFLSLFFP
jgi:hypothetical protein